MKKIKEPSELMKKSIDFMLHIVVISAFLYFLMPVVFMETFFMTMMWIIVLSFALLMAEIGIDKLMRMVRPLFILISMAVLIIFVVIMRYLWLIM